MTKKFEDSRDFLYLSDVYVYIEQFGKKGHQIGRKIGDMLELVTMGYCYNSEDLKNCMKTELALEGFSEAKHKVEFSFFDQDSLFGFIECKKVGVEVTVHAKTRERNLKLGIGDDYAHKINPRWLNREISFKIKCLKSDEEQVEISIISENTREQNSSEQNSNLINEKFTIPLDKRFLITLVENGTLKIIKPDEKLCEITEKVRLCHVFTLKKVDEGASFKIETCLTGPQTIEKAKQSALVALDVRKKILGKWGKEEKNDEDNLTSILVIGEASHWEEKSRKVVIKTIDHNLVVPDYIIVQAFEKFYDEFGDDFLKYINKNELKNNSKVQELIKEVITENENAIFYDLEDLNFKKIEKVNNSLVVSDL